MKIIKDLNNFLLFVNIALRHGHKLVRIQIELIGKNVRSADPFNFAGSCLDVDNIAGRYL